MKSNTERNVDGKLVHDILFWLGSHMSQNDAGTVAYKTVELSKFIHTQHRKLQSVPSDALSALFPYLGILREGMRSSFTHFEMNEGPTHTDTLNARLWKR